MGATRIMVIRHAEKTGTYDGTQYDGVNLTGDIAGANGSKDLITIGWLVFVFHRPAGKGPIEKFSLIGQMLLAEDAPPPKSG